MNLFSKIPMLLTTKMSSVFSEPHNIFEPEVCPLPLDQQAFRRNQLCCAAILFSFICLVLLSTVLITEASRAAFASRVADQVLRFHVVANSDSNEDQALKLQVRDALVAYMAQFNDSFDNANEAAAFVSDHCTELQRIAETVIRKAGYAYPVQASVTTCDFPDKTYGDLTFPAGSYQALRVEIGQAQGQNWWCVLYPLLCFTEEGMITVPQESQEILQESLSGSDYRRLEVRCKLWDWIHSFLF